MTGRNPGCMPRNKIHLAVCWQWLGYAWARPLETHTIGLGCFRYFSGDTRCFDAWWSQLFHQCASFRKDLIQMQRQELDCILKFLDFGRSILKFFKLFGIITPVDEYPVGEYPKCVPFQVVFDRPAATWSQQCGPWRAQDPKCCDSRRFYNQCNAVLDVPRLRLGDRVS